MEENEVRTDELVGQSSSYEPSVIEVPKQVQRKTIIFRTDDITANEITKLATINGSSISYMVRQLILKGLKYVDEIRLKLE